MQNAPPTIFSRSRRLAARRRSARLQREADPARFVIDDIAEDMLERLAFRVHWAKYLPEPGSPQGPSYLAQQYPRWNDFLRLRAALDPQGTFLSTYWRRQLGLH